MLFNYVRVWQMYKGLKRTPSSMRILRKVRSSRTSINIHGVTRIGTLNITTSLGCSRNIRAKRAMLDSPYMSR